jgi:hypothetical protein
MTVTDFNPEEIEDTAALAPGILLRGAEVGMAVLIGLLVCPPLAILAGPYLLVRHVREHHRVHQSSAVAHGLRRLRVREA